ncbi:uncharacterized protein LOC113283822 isoform X2 [Papaver somniferum]|uniref:uncharacterized protein LOC113283822 isoform X2 n=1 Tax=Papaver somniferum TaxID=3469 RepID=UPI000E6F70AE|nr:uncharacterized protein LOC113283822 isoform X2 [Papaver somniferum]
MRSSSSVGRLRRQLVYRRHLWEELTAVSRDWGLPWCVGGDFNEDRRMTERKNCSTTTRGILLDRFLFNSKWEDHYPSLVQKSLAKPLSDHKPVLLSGELIDWAPPPFRCEAMWMLEPTFIDILKEWWQSFSFEGSAGFVLAKKFQALKYKIKDWNKNVFGNIDRKCESQLSEIQLLDQQAGSTDFSKQVKERL